MNKTYASNFAFHFTQPDKDGLIIFAVDFRQLISIGTFSKRKNLALSQVSSFPIVFNAK